MPMETLPADKLTNFPPFVDTLDLPLKLGAPCCISDIHVKNSNRQVRAPRFKTMRSARIASLNWSTTS